MIKMPCLYVRTFEKGKVPTLTEAITPGCEWALEAGAASVKRDGTSCMFKDGVLYKRYDAKHGKTPPEGAIACGAPDEVTGHWPHWVPIGPNDRHHESAFREDRASLVDGATYELCGPMVNGNPEKLERATLLRHGADQVAVPTALSPAAFRAWLEDYIVKAAIEGLVFAHADGRFTKIRAKDFGHPWPAARAAR